MARPKGLEPLTGGLETRCSIRLSYERVPMQVWPQNRVRFRAGGILSIEGLLVKQVWRSAALVANAP